MAQLSIHGHANKAVRNCPLQFTTPVTIAEKRIKKKKNLTLHRTAPVPIYTGIFESYQ